MLATADVLAALESGALVRLVPRWYADAGAISIYFASRALLPVKTRAFIDWIVESFEKQRLAACRAFRAQLHCWHGRIRFVQFTGL